MQTSQICEKFKVIILVFKLHFYLINFFRAHILLKWHPNLPQYYKFSCRNYGNLNIRLPDRSGTCQIKIRPSSPAALKFVHLSFLQDPEGGMVAVPDLLSGPPGLAPFPGQQPPPPLPWLWTGGGSWVGVGGAALYTGGENT